MSDTEPPPINQELTAGIDVGGTKVHILDTHNDHSRRYITADYDSLDSVLEEYFTTIQARPARIAVGMAGPRDDTTGEVKLTNADWPAFNPTIATEKYGIAFSTTNDLVATMAGILKESSVEFTNLKPGTATPTGAKLVVAPGTGIGVASAFWDGRGGRYIILPSEGGHIGFQPKTEAEQQYLSYLLKKYPHASVELALSGKYGVDNLVDFTLCKRRAHELVQAIDAARQANRPVGAVLLAFASRGEGLNREKAAEVLSLMGAMFGSVVRDLAVTYKATGGVYIAGSVGLALGEYFASDTDFIERFICHGAVHDSWLERVPIQLVTEQHIAVIGALEIAKDL